MFNVLDLLLGNAIGNGVQPNTMRAIKLDSIDVSLIENRESLFTIRRQWCPNNYYNAGDL